MLEATKTLLERWANWKYGAEFMRSRLVYKSLDAVLTASLRPKEGRQSYLNALIKRKSSNYERVAAGTKLIDSFVPGFAQKVSNSLTDTSRFPFAKADVRLISYGSGSTVFLVERPEGEWVLKIYRRSLGKKGESLAQIANHFKAKYETVCGWYDGRFNLVPQAHFLILNGPIFSKPAAAVLQRYIPGNKSDFFLDYSNQDLLCLMEHDQALADCFLFFTERTLKVHQQHKLCVDFLGRENLMLVEENGRYKLMLIDYGIFNLKALYLRAPEVVDRIVIRLERISNLRRLLA